MGGGRDTHHPGRVGGRCDDVVRQAVVAGGGDKQDAGIASREKGLGIVVRDMLQGKPRVPRSGSDRVVDDVHAVVDGLVDGGDQGGALAAGVWAGLVDDDVGIRRHAAVHAEGVAGGGAGGMGAVAVVVHRVAQAAGQAVGEVPEADQLVVAGAGRRGAITAEAAERIAQAIGAERHVGAVDAGVDDADDLALTAALGAAVGHAVPDFVGIDPLRTEIGLDEANEIRLHALDARHRGHGLGFGGAELQRHAVEAVLVDIGGADLATELGRGVAQALLAQFAQVFGIGDGGRAAGVVLARTGDGAAAGGELRTAAVLAAEAAEAGGGRFVEDDDIGLERVAAGDGLAGVRGRCLEAGRRQAEAQGDGKHQGSCAHALAVLRLDELPDSHARGRESQRRTSRMSGCGL